MDPIDNTKKVIKHEKDVIFALVYVRIKITAKQLKTDRNQWEEWKTKHSSEGILNIQTQIVFKEKEL